MGESSFLLKNIGNMIPHRTWPFDNVALRIPEWPSLSRTRRSPESLVPPAGHAGYVFENTGKGAGPKKTGENFKRKLF